MTLKWQQAYIQNIYKYYTYFFIKPFSDFDREIND